MHTCETVRLEDGLNECSLKSKSIESGYWHLNCDLESRCILSFSRFAEWKFSLPCYCFYCFGDLDTEEHIHVLHMISARKYQHDP